MSGANEGSQIRVEHNVPPGKRLTSAVGTFELNANLTGLGSVNQRPTTLSRPSADFVTSVRVTEPYGRFGNNFYQLVNAVVLADRLRARDLQVPAFNLVSPLPIHGPGLSIVPIRPNNGEAVLSGSFYAPFGLESAFAGLDARFFSAVSEWVAEAVFGRFRAGVPTVVSNSVALHFRGGDIFDPHVAPHPWYVQPPAAYYVEALAHARTTGFDGPIEIVAEDDSNPAVNVVEDVLRRSAVPFSSRRGDLGGDLLRLISAGCVVCAMSTMSEAALLLSRNVRRFYSFRTHSSQVDFAPFLQSRVGEVLGSRGVHGYLVDDASCRFIWQKHWHRTAEQIELIRTFPREYLRLYRSV